MRNLLVLGVLLMSSAAQAQGKSDWKLVIHGGAGVIKKENITPEKESEIRAGLDRALAAGEQILAKGGRRSMRSRLRSACWRTTPISTPAAVRS